MNMIVGFNPQVNTVKKNYGAGNSQKQQVGFGRIEKAFIIIGNTAEYRTCKAIDLARENPLLIFGKLISDCGKKMALVLCTDKKDGKGLTFKSVEKFVNENNPQQLNGNFHLDFFEKGNKPNYGIIDLNK